MKKLVKAMVTATFPISQGKEAVAKAQEKGSLKVLIDMRSGDK